MRTAYRNTTALIAIFSLSCPTVVVGQGGKPGCDEETVGVTVEIAERAQLALTDAQMAALETGEAQDGAQIVKLKGQNALCLSPEDLTAMGATNEQLAAIMDLSGKDIAPAGSANAANENARGGPKAEEETAGAEPEAAGNAEEMATEETAAPAEDAVKAETDKATTGPEQEQAKAAPVEDTASDQAAASEPETAPGAEEMSEETTEDAAGTEAVVISEDADPEPRPEGLAAESDTTGEAATETAEAAETVEATELAAVQEAIEAQAVEEVVPEEQAAAAEQEAPEQAAAAADEAAEAAEVEETVVTEETARSSFEEFVGEMQTTEDADGASNSDGGLSDFEKALIAGLGAIVIGKALGDNDDARVVNKSQDRVVVLQDGRYRVIRDDNELIERPGSTVRRETFDDGSTRTTVTRDDGVQIVTIRDPELRVLRRYRIDTDGTRTVLIDDIGDVAPVDVAELPELEETEAMTASADVEALRKALDEANRQDRRFALYQVRNIERVRKLAPAIAIDAINFRTGSAVIDAEEARELADLGTLIADFIAERPNEIFLIEGHTDAVGGAAMNLALSDRRAESVALALTEYFDVPPENLVVQGYGESDLQVRTLEAERANRRAAVRRITPLLTGGN